MSTMCVISTVTTDSNAFIIPIIDNEITRRTKYLFRLEGDSCSATVEHVRIVSADKNDLCHSLPNTEQGQYIGCLLVAFLCKNLKKHFRTALFENGTWCDFISLEKMLQNWNMYDLLSPYFSQEELKDAVFTDFSFYAGRFDWLIRLRCTKNQSFDERMLVYKKLEQWIDEFHHQIYTETHTSDLEKSVCLQKFDEAENI